MQFVYKSMLFKRGCPRLAVTVAICTEDYSPILLRVTIASLQQHSTKSPNHASFVSVEPTSIWQLSTSMNLARSGGTYCIIIQKIRRQRMKSHDHAKF